MTITSDMPPFQRPKNWDTRSYKFRLSRINHSRQIGFINIVHFRHKSDLIVKAERDLGSNTKSILYFLGILILIEIVLFVLKLYTPMLCILPIFPFSIGLIVLALFEAAKRGL